jgi:hypothetical protein
VVATAGSLLWQLFILFHPLFLHLEITTVLQAFSMVDRRQRNLGSERRHGGARVWGELGDAVAAEGEHEGRLRPRKRVEWPRRAVARATDAVHPAGCCGSP